VGFQSFLRVLTQISPISDTFGWKILVKNTPLGGVWGKSLGRIKRTLNRPPSKGVPTVEKVREGERERERDKEKE